MRNGGFFLTLIFIVGDDHDAIDVIIAPMMVIFLALPHKFCILGSDVEKSDGHISFFSRSLFEPEQAVCRIVFTNETRCGGDLHLHRMRVDLAQEDVAQLLRSDRKF